jgi:2-polyprenyl-3-methyl-5-hydroxy-6-metoxy-1,4-benzoquinol methylase
MVSVPCNLCGGQDTRPWLVSTDYISGETFNLVRCGRCGLTYVNPRPSQERLVEYYPRTHQCSDPAAYERMDAKPRIKFVGGLLDGKSGRVLDVGCGKGLLLRGLRERGWDVVGTELSEDSSLRAREAGIQVYNVAVKELPFEPGSFDVITIYHSLEHLTSPRDTLTQLHRLLRPGGFLVVEVPNVGSWYARAFRDSWFHLDVPRHLYHFTPKTLRNLLEVSGFEIERARTVNLQYDSFGSVQSLLNRLLRRKNLLNNYNTGEVTLRDLWRQGGFRAVTSLFFSEALLGLGFPLMAAFEFLVSPVVNGGTLNVLAKRSPDQD